MGPLYWTPGLRWCPPTPSRDPTGWRGRAHARPRVRAVLAVTSLCWAFLWPAASPQAVAAHPSGLAGAQAQDEKIPLSSALQEHRHRLRLEGNTLKGPGAELLLQEAASARYLLVGEEHGTAEIPRLVADLFRRLQTAGYRHLAIEVGPVQARRLNDVLSGSQPEEALREHLRAHWPGVPFYWWKEEAHLLVSAARAAEEDDVLWGVDYDVMGDRYPLSRLRELAPDPAARATAARALALADSLLERATQSGDLSKTMMFSDPDTIWCALRATFEPEPGSEAEFILDQLESTARVNRAWIEERVWDSNQLRARLNKENFLRYRRRAGHTSHGRRSGGHHDPGAGWTGGKVLVKMGANHVMRGRTPTEIFDLGNLVSELAVAEGGESFHLAAVGGAGDEHAGLDTHDFGVEPEPTHLSRGEWGRPLAAAAYDKGWTLFDLRPVRPLMAGGRVAEVHPRLERMIYAYDAILVVSGSTPATALELGPGTSGAEGGR